MNSAAVRAHERLVLPPGEARQSVLEHDGLFEKAKFRSSGDAVEKIDLTVHLKKPIGDHS
jgi:hypothetical protein